MEHEVFVPVPAERLSEVLADPARVARAVPGLQQDADAEPVTGRLRLRVGGHTITYRGTLRLTRRDDTAYAVEGDATEARGTGSVRLALTLRVTDADGGATLALAGTATADGRIAELPPEAVTGAVTRLLNRFAEQLGLAAGPGARSAESLATEDFEPAAAGEFDAAPDADDAPAPPTGPTGPAGASPADTPAADTAGGAASVFDTEVPPSSLDPTTADEGVDAAEDGPVAREDQQVRESEEEREGREGREDQQVREGREGREAERSREGQAAQENHEDHEDHEDQGAPEAPEDPDAAGPPAEAAHARRTMIGRSAEEVDHAPPRGRYAPVPAPQTTVRSTSLRWAAPAAALVLASAIVVGRALRRRR